MYYVVFALFYVISLLPLRVLYLFSDLAYFFIYHVIGYRKEVVMKNLAIAFPEKSQEERLRIAKQFYHNFTDNFIETFKLISASRAFIERHFKGDFSIFDRLYQEGRKCQAHLGHNFNWEVGNVGMPLHTNYTMLTIYMPIKSKIIDRLFLYLRSRTGAVLLPATNMRHAMVPYRNSKYILALVADQNPGNPKAAYWIPFFGKPTPFLKGPEKGAKSADAAIVFVKFKRLKRGYYEAHFELATESPKDLPEAAITKLYAKYLEGVIREQPETYLWSHRRWKWDWKPEYGELIEGL